LQPVHEQHPADEPAGEDGEAALVEDNERHYIPLGGATRTRQRGRSTRQRR
jgi:hypothetical protein